MGGFIFGWWTLAFQVPTSNAPPFVIVTQTLPLSSHTLLEALSPLSRDSLERALAGDFSLIPELVVCWEKDAEALIANGVEGVQRLSPEKIAQVKILGNLLTHTPPDLLRELNCRLNQDYLQDDCGVVFPIKDEYSRFFPQTYVSAHFLLAIAKPHEIVAIPKGLRHFKQFFSSNLLEMIKADTEEINSERLSLHSPHMAFIAPYSYPPFLQTLYNGQIPLYTLKNINTPGEIEEALLKVGHASNHILEAQLLALFMEASLLAIDNRLEAIKESRLLRVLYLTYHQHYALPTTKSLAGQLMSRALSHCYPLALGVIPESRQEWEIPFDQEQIEAAKPDVLIIAAAAPKAYVRACAHFHSPHMFRQKKLFCLDEATQNSPTQHIAIAYFDLYQTLLHCL